MEPMTAKAISMLALGLGSFIAGMAPAGFSEAARQKHPLLLSCLLCFGGGVLLSTSLVHMLPEAREKLPEYTEFMVCVGFFIVYLIDEIVHVFYGTTSETNREDGMSYGSGEETTLLTREEDGERCCGETENTRICHVGHSEPSNTSSSGVLGLLSALFIHSLLEGLAIGLQEDTSQVLLLLGAVASHKFVVGFCLGAELCASFPSRLCLHIICVMLFSGGSVIGIAIGAGMETVNALKESVMVPIMQALAAGTLLYVTVSEVLPRERARWHDRKRTAGLAQFVAVIIGFGLMFITTKYLDYDG